MKALEAGRMCIRPSPACHPCPHLCDGKALVQAQYGPESPAGTCVCLLLRWFSTCTSGDLSGIPSDLMQKEAPHNRITLDENQGVRILHKHTPLTCVQTGTCHSHCASKGNALTFKSSGTSGEAFSFIVRDALVCITNRLAMPCEV